MASDLSKLIPENLSITLGALLAKDTKLVECTKVDERDFEHNELLRVDVEFVFDKLTTLLSYYIPAQSASKIFNIMMGAPENDVLTKIDDDTADAMAEFISNTCGGLVTELNSVQFEDLGKSKFNIKHKEILDGNSIESVENIYRFLIDIDGVDSLVFTKFEENFNEFITELTNSKPTYYPEIVPEKIEEEIIEEKEEEKEKNDLPIKETSKEESDDNSKNKKFKMIIIIVSTLIVTTILTGIIMYMSGMFEPEPIEKPKDTNSTEIKKNEMEVIQYKTLKKIDFKMNDINTQRLNSKLELLTKYQILTQEELESQALEEKERIIQLKKEQELIEFAKQNKEEPLILKEKEEINKDLNVEEPVKKEIHIVSNTTPNLIETTPKVDSSTKIEDKKETTTDNKLKFVLANSLKYKLFKELVMQTNSLQARISICNNDSGKTQIFIGPFETEELQVKMNMLIKEADAGVETLISNITTEEFDSKCNF